MAWFLAPCEDDSKSDSTLLLEMNHMSFVMYGVDPRITFALFFDQQ